MVQWILAGLTLFLIAVWVPTWWDERKRKRDGR